MKKDTPRHGHRIEIRERIMIVTLDRPHRANALDLEACKALDETFDRFEADENLVVAILTGAGRNFCAGMDLSLMRPGQRVVLPPSGFGGVTARKTDKALIAAVHGAALGGGFEIALACDIIIADRSARFGLPEPRVGQAALAGGLERLPLAVGQKRAMEIILTGAPITAEKAEAIGVANQVVPEGKALIAALVMAKEISKSAPVALQASKAVAQIRERAACSPEGALKRPPIVDQMLDSLDAQEGAKAFLEKRAPQWSGK